ncbi:MAG: methyl-accepting chemotaxis protein [Candidatus Eremiobacteraeota bacterium]|nr:methyl-accepting chemotaxis protein [Candidatus Eremiobacteraeota bacterium]
MKTLSLYDSAKQTLAYFSAVLVLLAIACGWTIVVSNQALMQSVRSAQIRGVFRRIKSELLTVESAQRGYLYTGQSAYWLDLDQERQGLEDLFREGEQLIEDRDQLARLHEVRRLAELKLRELSDSIRLYQNGEPERAKAMVLQGVGHNLMIQLDSLLDQGDATEDGLVDQHRKNFQQATRLLEVVLGAGLVGLFILALVWLSQVRRRLEPLTDCVEMAGLVARGEFPDEKLEVQAFDEVGALTASLNRMLDSLVEAATQTEKAQKKVHETSLSLSQSAVEQAAAVTQQAAGVQEMSTTLQELSHSAAQVAQQASEVGGESREIRASGNRGLRAVQESGEAAQAVRRGVEAMAETTVTLNERAEKVEQIVFSVNELAERSNILSINAALLAASAGDQGKAFGVLANEMQRLAVRSKEATVEAHQILHEIRGEIHRVVMLSEEAVKRVEAGERHSSRADESIRALVEVLQRGDDAFQQIVAATRQQSLALRQVEEALLNIRESSEQVSLGSRRLEKEAESLTQLSGDLERAPLVWARQGSR